MDRNGDGNETGDRSLDGAVAALHDTVGELTPVLGFPPVTRVTGPVGELSPEVVTDLRAVLREALTNVGRHAQAHAVEIHLEVTDGRVALRVTDDGIGCAGPPKDGGLADLRRRAAWHGGSITVEPGASGGTRLTWAVPLR